MALVRQQICKARATDRNKRLSSLVGVYQVVLHQAYLSGAAVGAPPVLPVKPLQLLVHRFLLLHDVGAHYSTRASRVRQRLAG